jgi:hypothetical protein
MYTLVAFHTWKKTIVTVPALPEALFLEKKNNVTLPASTQAPSHGYSWQKKKGTVLALPEALFHGYSWRELACYFL